MKKFFFQGPDWVKVMALAAFWALMGTCALMACHVCLLAWHIRQHAELEALVLGPPETTSHLGGGE